MNDWDGRGLVSTDWLSEHLADPNLRLFDATVHLRPATPGPYRIESGRADYEAAHIPGAAFIDLARDLSDPDSPLNFTRLPVDRLAAAFAAAGIGGDSRVVVYSSTTPMWATRVWWMLRAAGIHEAAVLDGGLARWTAEGRAVEAGERRYPPADLRLTERPEAWADQHDVLAAIDDGAICTINALSPSVHSGEAARSCGRKGHIKGNRNVPYAALRPWTPWASPAWDTPQRRSIMAPCPNGQGTRSCQWKPGPGCPQPWSFACSGGADCLYPSRCVR